MTVGIWGAGTKSQSGGDTKEGGMLAVYLVSGARNIAPEAERDNWSARQALDVFETRLGPVRRQLERTPWLAGDASTAADIAVGYALEMAGKNIG